MQPVKLCSVLGSGEDFVIYVARSFYTQKSMFSFETFGAASVGCYTLAISCEDTVLCLEAILGYDPGVTFCKNLLPSIYIYITRHYCTKWQGKTFWAESKGLFQHPVYFVDSVTASSEHHDSIDAMFGFVVVACRPVMMGLGPCCWDQLPFGLTPQTLRLSNVVDDIPRA